MTQAWKTLLVTWLGLDGLAYAQPQSRSEWIDSERASAICHLRLRSTRARSESRTGSKSSNRPPGGEQLDQPGDCGEPRVVVRREGSAFRGCPLYSGENMKLGGLKRPAADDRRRILRRWPRRGRAEGPSALCSKVHFCQDIRPGIPS